MLSSADRAVLDRDPLLPGLRYLLDLDALTAVLCERSSGPCRVIPGRLRYKPGTSGVLSFGLHLPGAARPVPCIAKAYAPQAAAKVVKSLRGLPPDGVLVSDPQLLLVVTTIVGDRHLAGATRLFGTDTRPALLRRLLPGHDRLVDGVVRTLRHNPERRWVGVLQAGPDRVVLRSYRDTAAAAQIRAYSLLGASSPRTPALVGSSRKYGMVAVEWADGVPLHRSGDLEGFRAAGDTLAQLHRREPPGLPQVGAPRQQRQLSDAAAQVSHLVPELSRDVDELAATLTTRLAGLAPQAMLLHGDFSADQVVLDDAGAATLIDLDSACAGHPAQDLGSLWAAALTGAGGSGRSVGDQVGALLEGYRKVLPLPSPVEVALYRDVYLLRRAAEAFRNRDYDWAEQARRVVALARSDDTGVPA